VECTYTVVCWKCDQHWLDDEVRCVLCVWINKCEKRKARDKREPLSLSSLLPSSLSSSLFWNKSVSWQFCSPFQNEFSGECELRKAEKKKLRFDSWLLLTKFLRMNYAPFPDRNIRDVHVMVTACQKSVSL
jgi:hypothetical protein